MCRITVDGEVKQFSCKMDVPLHLWDVKNNRASGGYTAQRTEPDIYQRFRIFPVRKEKMSYQYRMGIYDCAETYHFHHTEHRAVAVQSLCGIYQQSRKRGQGLSYGGGDTNADRGCDEKHPPLDTPCGLATATAEADYERKISICFSYQ